jgi:regulator of telomere elongation helicase 1
MEKVIQSLQEKKNALLESPTGTGKTLCLLCSSLAWRDHLKKSLAHQDERSSNSLKSESSEEQNSISDSQKAKGAPKIIYASRTHSQLTQVIKELKNTAYRPKTCILGARSQLCIHPTVSNARGEAQNQMCRQLVTSFGCEFHQNIEGTKRDESIINKISDIEEMVEIGKYHATCPYYLGRELQKTADIIFMPYNYLIDSNTRSSLNIDLEDSVILFDEAHNLVN